MLIFYNKHKNLICLINSVLLVLVSTLPYFILGEGSYAQLHDQMDGENSDDTMELELVEGSPFSSETSFYEIWIYKISE